MGLRMRVVWHVIVKGYLQNKKYVFISLNEIKAFQRYHQWDVYDPTDIDVCEKITNIKRNKLEFMFKKFDYFINFKKKGVLYAIE
jgi:hypothetical protein